MRNQASESFACRGMILATRNNPKVKMLDRLPGRRTNIDRNIVMIKTRNVHNQLFEVTHPIVWQRGNRFDVNPRNDKKVPGMRVGSREKSSL